MSVLGLLRDLLIGATPPAALRDGRYTVVAFLTGVVVFLLAGRTTRVASAVRLFDAAGTTKALSASAVGCLTGIGGGIMRDVIVAEVPVVLRRELYAVPAVLGATVVTVGSGFELDPGPTAAAGAGLRRADARCLARLAFPGCETLTACPGAWSSTTPLARPARAARGGAGRPAAGLEEIGHQPR